MKNSRIGERCNIGQNVVVSSDVTIGNNVKIQNNVSVYTGCTLEDDVFCGPSMVFTNVINPRSHVVRKDEYKPTLVKRGASLGANCTVICGHTIGRYAFVGAGSVVTRDVPDYALIYGNPARLRGWMCACGIKLDFAGGRTPVPSARPAGRIFKQRGGCASVPNRRKRYQVYCERQVPLLDLESQHRPIRDEVLAEVMRVIDSQKFILGDEVKHFESEIASIAGGSRGRMRFRFRRVIAGTAGSGDRAGRRSHHHSIYFFRNSGSNLARGAMPVFVDVDDNTYNIDTKLLRQAIERHPKARP